MGVSWRLLFHCDFVEIVGGWPCGDYGWVFRGEIAGSWRDGGWSRYFAEQSPVPFPASLSWDKPSRQALASPFYHILI